MLILLKSPDLTPVSVSSIVKKSSGKQQEAVFWVSSGNVVSRTPLHRSYGGQRAQQYLRLHVGD